MFFAGHQPILDHLIAKPTVKITLAVAPDDADTIMGYLVSERSAIGSRGLEFLEPERDTIHFLFVKDVYRKMGIAKGLLDAAGIDVAKITFTHWTFPVDTFMERFPEMVYDPYKL